MCYDIKASLETQLKRAYRRGDLKAVEEIKTQLAPYTDLPLYHVSGFSHPTLLMYTTDSPDIPVLGTWGLVPHWVKDKDQQRKIWNNTLNARGETLFEKPSFRYAAENHHCVIYVDGFYEHYHFEGKTYPFFIHKKDGEPLALAGLFNEWQEPDSGSWLTSFTIVTTDGNALLSKIHNNPKLDGPRMPVILPEEWVDKWLRSTADELDRQQMEELIVPYAEEELTAYPVGKLRGKEYAGNTEGISERVTYPELDSLVSNLES